MKIHFEKANKSHIDIIFTWLVEPYPRGKHVYMKAGFEHVADFVISGNVSEAGKSHHLLIRRFVNK